MKTAFLASFLLCLVTLATAHYLPGVARTSYKEGDVVEVTVNTLRSAHTVLPYEFFDERFNFCAPEGGIEPASSNLGSVLFGDRLFHSPIHLKMLRDSSCNVICTKTLTKDQVNFMFDRIQERYMMYWYVDGLPAGQKVKHGNDEFYRIGFDLGIPHNKKADTAPDQIHPKLHNHYFIVVEYHRATSSFPPLYDVVGVLLLPASKKYTLKNGVPNCEKRDHEPLLLHHDEEVTVTYTYEVRWKESEVPWEKRWDSYLYHTDDKVHVFSVVNSIIVVLFMTFMVAVILLRSLRRDILRYNSEPGEDSPEEYGWKLVHGDVFRTPKKIMLLAVLSGNGVQLSLMALTTICLALFGFLSPSSRGTLLTVAIVFYMLFGLTAGYTSARLYKMLGGEAWKRSVLLTATLVPGTVSVIVIVLNFFLVGMGSSAAIPFGTLVGLLAMWILISCPLCFLGAHFGFKKQKAEFPVKVNFIPRQIPAQPFYLRRVPSILLGGILPFVTIYFELFFVMNSIWFNEIYYVFGFLAVVFILLVLTCCEVTILISYFLLCNEDYRWWWRSFFTSGCCALYVFLYGITYFCFHLQMQDFVSSLLYFGWSLVATMVFFIMTGSVGFLSCLWFLMKIYSAIKID